MPGPMAVRLFARTSDHRGQDRVAGHRADPPALFRRALFPSRLSGHPGVAPSLPAGHRFEADRAVLAGVRLRRPQENYREDRRGKNLRHSVLRMWIATRSVTSM